MSTNYYYTDTLGNELHIGKSSAGWPFSLRIHPNDRINDLGDWIHLMSVPGGNIKTEYGDTVTMMEMLRVILDRGVAGKDFFKETYISSGGYSYIHCDYEFC